MENFDFDDFLTDELISTSGIDMAAIERATARLLRAIGEDPQRQGLRRTPQRVARMYAELMAGYRIDPVALVNDALFDHVHDSFLAGVEAVARSCLRRLGDH